MESPIREQVIFNITNTISERHSSQSNFLNLIQQPHKLYQSKSMEEYQPLIRNKANRAYVTCKNTKNTSSHSNGYSHSQILVRQNGKRPNHISETEHSTNYLNVSVHHRATNHTHIREQIIQYFSKSDPKSQNVNQFEVNKKTPN